MTNLQSDVNFSAKDLCLKEISKLIIPLHVMTGCGVRWSFFGVGKRTVWTCPENYRSSNAFDTLLAWKPQ